MMLFEKYEACPNCGVTEKWHYDYQRCDACGVDRMRFKPMKMTPTQRKRVDALIRERAGEASD